MNTSLEQSKKLIEVGIDINTADMFYADILVNDEHKYIIHPLESYGFKTFKDTKGRESAKLKFIPAWSLSALLDLMPKVISIMVSEDAAYRYELEWQFANDNSIRYVGSDRKCLIDIYSDHDDDKWKDLIDTAFEMVCWLKENGKI